MPSSLPPFSVSSNQLDVVAAPQPPAPGRSALPSQPPTLPPDAPVPPPIARRPRGVKWLLAAAVVALVAALVLGSATVHRLNQSRTPEAVVAAYFDALSTGDAPAALALAADAPSDPMLTSTVLRQQLRIAPLSQVRTGVVRRSGAQATVQVSYRLDFADGATSVLDEAKLVRHGNSWRLATVAGAITLSPETTGTQRLTLAGRPLPHNKVVLFPGAAPVLADSTAITVTGDPAVTLRDSGSYPDLEVAVSNSARQQISAAVDKMLASCLRGTPADPLCPSPDTVRPVPASLRGVATKKVAAAHPQVYLDADGSGIIDLDAEVPVRGSWQVWNFENQAVTRRGSTTVELSAQVAVDRLGTVYWVQHS